VLGRICLYRVTRTWPLEDSDFLTEHALGRTTPYPGTREERYPILLEGMSWFDLERWAINAAKRLSRHPANAGRPMGVVQMDIDLNACDDIIVCMSPEQAPGKRHHFDVAGSPERLRELASEWRSLDELLASERQEA